MKKYNINNKEVEIIHNEFFCYNSNLVFWSYSVYHLWVIPYPYKRTIKKWLIIESMLIIIIDIF